MASVFRKPRLRVALGVLGVLGALVVALVVALLIALLIARLNNVRMDVGSGSRVGLAVVAIAAGLLTFAVDKFAHVNAATSTALLGMCFAGTLKFMVYHAVGTERAAGLWNRSPRRAWKHALGMMTTETFVLHTLSTLLNIFLSAMLFKPTYVFLSRRPLLRHKHALVSGLTTTLTLGLVSCACSDTLRHTSVGADVASRGTMHVTMTLAAASFLASDTQLFSNEPGINQPSVKLALVLGAMCMLCILGRRGAATLSVSDIASSRIPLSTGDTVHGSRLRGLDGERLDDVDYRITRAVHGADGAEYIVARVEPEARDLSGRSMYGSLVLMLIGAVTSGTTIFGTGKSGKHHLLAVFAGVMAITTAIASPGLAA